MLYAKWWLFCLGLNVSSLNPSYRWPCHKLWYLHHIVLHHCVIIFQAVGICHIFIHPAGNHKAQFGCGFAWISGGLFPPQRPLGGPTFQRQSPWGVMMVMRRTHQLGEIYWVGNLLSLGQHLLNGCNTIQLLHTVGPLWHDQLSPNYSQRNLIYCKISNIRRTKSDYWSYCRLVLQLPLANPLKPGVKLIIKM